MSSESERLLKAILAELRAIRAAGAPDTKPKSGSSVSSVLTRNGVVIADDALEDIPRQLTGDEQQAMRWAEWPRRMTPGRSATRPVEGRGR